MFILPQVPKDVHDVLLRVQDHCRRAILVGGYLRDLQHHKEPKDIDIVVEFGTPYETIYDALSGTDIDVDTIESSAQDVNFSFEVKFNLPALSLPVNLIGACHNQSPLEKLKLHDFGLCQIWYDGSEVQCTPAYRHDVERQVFSLQRCRSYEEWDAVYKHYERLQRKYPWPMEISANFLKSIKKGFPEDSFDF